MGFTARCLPSVPAQFRPPPFQHSFLTARLSSREHQQVIHYQAAPTLRYPRRFWLPLAHAELGCTQSCGRRGRGRTESGRVLPGIARYYVQDRTYRGDEACGGSRGSPMASNKKSLLKMLVPKGGERGARVKADASKVHAPFTRL